MTEQVYVKAVYKVVEGKVVEKNAFSHDEEFAFYADGWYPHPQEARDAGPVVAVADNKKINDMDDTELINYAKLFGIKLDRRFSRDKMLSTIEGYLK